jgi:hypothetical protein
MPKTPKAPFSTIHRPTDSELRDAIRPVPFQPCRNCGQPKISSEKYCVECKRLVCEGFGVTPRAPYPTVVDTQESQSYPSHNQSGYRDSISSKKIPPTRERY